MSAATRLLLVEDDEADAALILASLKSSGLNINSQRVWTRDDLAQLLKQQSWDVVLCDYNLPQFDGLSALAMVKTHDPDIPFIIVSGAIGEETAVAAMRNGAQDFVMKQSLRRLGAVVVRELGDADTRRSAQLAAQSLQANQALLNSIINTAADGIAVVDLHGVGLGGSVRVGERHADVDTVRDQLRQGRHRDGRDHRDRISAPLRDRLGLRRHRLGVRRGRGAAPAAAGEGDGRGL